MGGASNLVKSLAGTATGGLLFKPDLPKAKKPPKSGQLDPNLGAAHAAARRRRQAAAGAANRASFRIDLSTGGGGEDLTRSGLTIS